MMFENYENTVAGTFVCASQAMRTNAHRTISFLKTVDSGYTQFMVISYHHRIVAVV